MTYNLSNELDLARFKVRASTLIKKGAAVELTEKAFRTLSQNSYLHLIIGVVAMETGTTLEYCKQVYFKKLVNPAFFVIEKRDPIAGQVEILRSITELSKEEISMAIDRFKRWANENGIMLPDPGDEERLKLIEIELSKLKNYL